MARRLALTFVALVAVALVVEPALAQQPRRGGVVRIADREAPNLDPHLAISFLTHSWANMVYSQLVRYPHGPEQKHPADFAIVPDLAEKWEYKSPTVIEFTLQEGRQVPQQAAGQRARGHGRRREVLDRAVHGQVGRSGRASTSSSRSTSSTATPCASR